jgi:CspA family cold shock protein
MSKYRNHREPRRQGFEDDNYQAPEPTYFQRELAQPATARILPPVDAEVLWFNVDKGFGFVKLADDTKVFLHVRALESAGHSVVSEGTHLTVRIGQGEKGPQVAEVVSVSAGAASAASRSTYPSVQGSNTASNGDESEGTVKFYNAEKGFGFIAFKAGSKDAFVHISALKRCGLESLEEGQRVVVELAQGPKGPEVRALRLA